MIESLNIEGWLTEFPADTYLDINIDLSANPQNVTEGQQRHTSGTLDAVFAVDGRPPGVGHRSAAALADVDVVTLMCGGRRIELPGETSPPLDVQLRGRRLGQLLRLPYPTMVHGGTSSRSRCPHALLSAAICGPCPPLCGWATASDCSPIKALVEREAVRERGQSLTERRPPA